jgi:hypothetical protein
MWCIVRGPQVVLSLLAVKGAVDSSRYLNRAYSSDLPNACQHLALSRPHCNKPALTHPTDAAARSLNNVSSNGSALSSMNPVWPLHNLSHRDRDQESDMAMSIEMMNEYGTHAVRVSIDEATVLLEAQEVDAVIERLSLIRAAMRPEVPKEPSRSHKYVIEMDPCWHTEKHPLYEGGVIFMRHSGLGWTGFALPTQSLSALNEAVSKLVQTLQKEETENHALMN